MEVWRSPELEAVIAEARAAYDRDDDAWFAAQLAEGDYVITGTAPGEISRGKQTVLEEGHYSIAAAKEAHAAAHMEYDLGEVEAYEAGDAGFSIWHSRYVFDDGSYIPLRGVTVYARDPSGWKMIGRFGAAVVANELLAPGSPLAVAPAVAQQPRI